MSGPRVTVIIPNYNHAEFLEQRIKSVLLQTFTDFELIILDDASTDNSRAIIEKFEKEDKRISFYPSSNNSGSPFVQWNKGVKLATTDLIWIAESDDTASPEFLDVMVHQHVSNPDLALAYCQSTRMDDASTITGTWRAFTDIFDVELFSTNFVMEGIDFLRRFLIHRNVIPNASAVLFKKSVYDQVDGADENLKTNSDWLTWMKMLLNHQLAFVSASLNNFRYHKHSVIAKVHAVSNGKYKEQYDLSMRKVFDCFCSEFPAVVPSDIVKENKKYQSFDYGKKGIYEFYNGQYYKGLVNIFRASLSPAFTLGYFKQLLKDKNLI